MPEVFLTNLKDERENSDYEIFSVINEEIAREAIKEAEEFVEEAKRYLKKDALIS